MSASLRDMLPRDKLDTEQAIERQRVEVLGVVDLIAHSDDLARALESELRRLASNPTAGERVEEVSSGGQRSAAALVRGQALNTQTPAASPVDRQGAGEVFAGLR